MKVEHFLLNYSSKKLNIPNFRLKYHQMPGFAWPATYMGVLGKVQMTSWSRFFSSLGITKVFRLLVVVFHSIFCLLVSDSLWRHWDIWISHNFVTWWSLNISFPLAFLWLASIIFPVSSYQTNVDNNASPLAYKVTILDTVQSINFGIYFLADESIRLINANWSQHFTLIVYNNELDMR